MSLLRNFAVGTFILVIALFAILTLVDDLNTNYEEVNIQSSEIQEFSKSKDDLNNISKEMIGSMEQIDEFVRGGEVDSLDAVSSVVSGATSGVKLISAPFGITMGFISSAATVLHIEQSFVTLGLGILAAIIVFALILLYFRVSD